MNNSTFRDLLDKYLTGTMSTAEKDRLKALLEDPVYNEELLSQIDTELKNRTYEGEANAEILALIQKNITEKIKVSDEKPGVLVLPVQNRRFAFLRHIAAAVLLLLLGTGVFLLIKKKWRDSGSTAATSESPVSPGTARLYANKTLLTLADGSTIMVDTLKPGRLNPQGQSGFAVVKSGEIKYLSNNENNTEKKSSYNTLTTAWGQQYVLTLPDGSRVWLNAGTSLHFPTAFTGNDRRVELKGEAYFEVSHNKEKPFKVVTDKAEVTVLGTHFNISAYEEEPVMQTTLLEGSVLVKNNHDEKRLIPGQQATIKEAGGLVNVSKGDPAVAIAWKNGLFEFKNLGIEAIMRELQRWYNIDVSYKYITKDTFVASIQRSDSLPDLLKLLESTGHIHFNIDGRLVTVMK